MDEKKIMVLLPRNRYDQVNILLYKFIKVFTITIYFNS